MSPMPPETHRTLEAGATGRHRRVMTPGPLHDGKSNGNRETTSYTGVAGQVNDGGGILGGDSAGNRMWKSVARAKRSSSWRFWNSPKTSFLKMEHHQRPRPERDRRNIIIGHGILSPGPVTIPSPCCRSQRKRCNQRIPVRNQRLLDQAEAPGSKYGVADLSSPYVTRDEVTPFMSVP